MQTTTKKMARQQRQKKLSLSPSLRCCLDAAAPAASLKYLYTRLKHYHTIPHRYGQRCPESHAAQAHAALSILHDTNSCEPGYGSRGVQRHAQRPGENRSREQDQGRSMLHAKEAKMLVLNGSGSDISKVAAETCSQAESSTTRCGRGCAGRQSVSALLQKRVSCAV